MASSVSDKQLQLRYLNLLLGGRQGQPKKVASATGEEKRRELLAVENEAIENKQKRRQIRQQELDEVSEKIQQMILEGILIEQESGLFNSTLQLEPELGPILDLLSMKAVTISKVEPLIEAIPWLKRELMRLVNNPKHARKNASGEPINVDSLRVAIGIIGLDELLALIPSLVVRRVLPQTTDPYPSIKLNLWKLSLANGVAAKTVASYRGLKANYGFAIGMFSHLGIICILKRYFRLFDKALQGLMEEAHGRRDIAAVALLAEVTPSAKFIRQMLISHGDLLQGTALQEMGCKRLPLAQVHFERAQSQDREDLSPYAKAMHDGMAFARLRLLQQGKQLKDEEIKPLISGLDIEPECFSLLKKTHLGRIGLKIAN